MTKNQGLNRSVRRYQADNPGMTCTPAPKTVMKDRESSVIPDEERHERELPIADALPSDPHLG
jgi:hypothetical protein